jgi:hypothetical protein
MILDILRREVGLCYGFVRRDLGTGLLPVPGFTLASLLYRGALVEEMIPVIARMCLYPTSPPTLLIKTSRCLSLRIPLPLHFRRRKSNRRCQRRQDQQARPSHRIWIYDPVGVEGKPTSYSSSSGLSYDHLLRQCLFPNQSHLIHY